MAHRVRRSRAICRVLLLLVASGAIGVAAEREAAPPVVPSVIQVDARLEPLVARMLARSPTFRRQCRAIADIPGVVVVVRLVPPAKRTDVHATTELHRYGSGLVVARVAVPAAVPQAELIAHEFEHVLEFAEGVDLAALVTASPGEASRASDGSFETRRAVAVGRAANAEFYGR
jgi:hypothetical protein